MKKSKNLLKSMQDFIMSTKRELRRFNNRYIENEEVIEFLV